MEVKSCATERCPTPPGPEGSNGQQRVLCDTGKLDLFCFGFLQAHGLRTHHCAYRRRATPVVNDGLNHMPFIPLLLNKFLTIAVRIWDARSPAQGEHGFSRSETELQRVFRSRGMEFRSGHVPVRLEAPRPSRSSRRHRWNMVPYEKRYYHQFDGERTSYRHS